MSEHNKGENGFLFNVVSNIGDGHQIQAAFNLPVGAGKSDMDKIFDEYFRSINRQAARLRVPAIEQQVKQQEALVEGVKKSVDRLREAPQLNGKRRTQDEAAYQQVQAQMDADAARLAILNTNLELTYKEAEIEGSKCPIAQVS